MKIVQYILIFLILCGLSPAYVYAQGNPWYPEEDTVRKKKLGAFWQSSENESKSIRIGLGHELGGKAYKGMAYQSVQLGYSYKRWEGGFSFFNTATTVKWGQGDQTEVSSARYAMWGFGAFGRAYMSKYARNAFAEIGLSAAYPSMKVTYANQNIKSDSWKQQFITWGGGWRQKIKKKGIFFEVGYRGVVPVHRLVLYTDTDFPTITYASPPRDQYYWYFKRWRPMHQFYGGIGFSF